VLSQELITDLTYLGEHGQPGDEKNLVLKVFMDVATAVQQDKRYTGRELEEVIRSLGTLLHGKAQTGNDENYKRAADLLKNIWSKVPSEISSYDAMLAASMLKQLGFKVVEEKSEEIAFIYIKNAAAWDSSAVFELGLRALEVKRIRIAIEALNKLEALAEHGGVLRPTETLDNLLGLLAHFIAYSPSALMRAEVFLSRTRDYFQPTLKDCINVAVYHHYIAGNFATADALVEMLEYDFGKIKR